MDGLIADDCFSIDLPGGRKKKVPIVPFEDLPVTDTRPTSAPAVKEVLVCNNKRKRFDSPGE
jgi:hypothetical protein